MHEWVETRCPYQRNSEQNSHVLTHKKIVTVNKISSEHLQKVEGVVKKKIVTPDLKLTELLSWFISCPSNSGDHCWEVINPTQQPLTQQSRRGPQWE